jgi:hypothetical protein
MAGFGKEGERLGDALPAYQGNIPEPVDPQQGRPVDSPLAPVLQERQGWQRIPHEELVQTFRRLIEQQERLFRGAKSPEEIVRMQLENRWKSRQFNDEQLEEEKTVFFFQLQHAWDVLAFDRYDVPSGLARSAAYNLSHYYHEERRHGRTPTIKLADPLQVKILDALTEAIGLSHQKGQADIEIPQKLWNYGEYIQSEEHLQRWEQAQAQRRK